MIFLGILIIVCLAFVVMKVIQPKATEPEKAVLLEEILLGKSFETDFTIPAGQEILGTDIGEKGLVLRIGKEGRLETIVIIDFTGSVKGTVNVKRAGG